MLIYPGNEGNDVAKIVYSEAELEKAKKDIKLALGYVDYYTGISEELIREKIVTEQILKPIEKSMNLTIKTILNGGQNEKDRNL